MSVDGGSVGGMVAAVRRMAIHDGPGIRTVVFLKGCPLRCAWCAAPETQADACELVRYPERCIACGHCNDVCRHGTPAGGSGADAIRCTACGACAHACPAEARRLVGRAMRVPEVLEAVERDAVFYRRSGGGVTISGGEPLQQAAFTHALLVACRARRIHTALETTGFQTWEVFEPLLSQLDLLLFDLKHMDPERHRAHTGVRNELILENLRRATASGVPTVIRVPVVPTFTDDEENFRAMAAFLRPLPVRQVDLLPYHRLGEQMYARLGRAHAPRIPVVTPARLADLAATLEAAGLRVSVGG